MSITDLITERILVHDGAMGTIIQREHLTEGDFRGQRFVNLRDLDVQSMYKPMCLWKT
jgi:5-methyltetrahydrofolate--homocysteine methyltransferase